MYKHVYGDFIKDEKEKSQYQDTICSEAEEGNGDRPWEVLYDYIVNPAALQASEETSGVNLSTQKKSSPSAFLSYDCWKTYPSARTRLLWECFQILIFWVVIARSFPFFPLLRHYALLVLWMWITIIIGPSHYEWQFTWPFLMAVWIGHS